MSEELIECSCCGKMLPAENLELAFRRPDDVAALSNEELEMRCAYTDEICILDEERFFVRCTIPLPVHMSSDAYAIGAWAEISKPDFDLVREVWDEVDQSGRPAIQGSLANQIPTTTGSLGCHVAVKLVGHVTRPNILIADDACSLFQEQKDGIHLHRASAYSDIFRKKPPAKPDLQVVEEQELVSGRCSCCDQNIRTYCGHITSGDDHAICADYWIRIPEGHGGFFTVAVSIADGGQARVAVLVGEARDDGLTYRLLDREDSPWEDFGDYGGVMDRNEVLADPAKPVFFRMVDAIAAHDSRLVAHTGPFIDAQ